MSFISIPGTILHFPQSMFQQFFGEMPLQDVQNFVQEDSITQEEVFEGNLFQRGDHFSQFFLPEKLNIRDHFKSIPLLFLRKYEIFPLPEGKDFFMAKEVLREYLKNGYVTSISFKDTVLCLALLAEIAEENPELSTQIQNFIYIIMQDHPRQLLNQIQKIELHDLPIKEKKMLRNIAKSYYQTVFKYLMNIFKLLPSAKESFEESFFIRVGNQGSAIKINPLVVLLHLNKHEIVVLLHTNKDQLNPTKLPNKKINTLLNVLNNHLFKSNFCRPLSLEGEVTLNYFVDLMPPIEFFLYAKVHPFFKTFLQGTLRNLSIQLKKDELITYLDFANEYIDLSKWIINSINHKASNLQIHNKLLDLKTLVILEFAEEDILLIEKLINNFSFERFEVTIDSLKKIRQAGFLTDLKDSVLAIELPLEFLSNDGDEVKKQKIFEELVQIGNHECILPPIENNSFDISFIHSLFTKSSNLTILNLGRLFVNDEILKIAVHQKIQILILSHNNNLSSLDSLKKLPNLKKVFFENHEKAPYSTLVKNFEMIGDLSSWREENSMESVFIHSQIECLMLMLENPLFLEELDNIKILSCFSNLDQLKSKFVEKFLSKISEEQTVLILNQPQLAFRFFPFLIKKIKQTPSYFDTLVASLQSWMKSSKEREYSFSFKEDGIDDLNNLLQARPQLLEDALFFWIEFMEKYLLPEGYYYDLAARIIQKIDLKNLDQQKRIIEIIKNNSLGVLPSETFLEAIFNLPWLTKHTKTACLLVDRFSQHTAFFEPDHGILQMKVWDILCRHAKKGFVNKDLELGFVASFPIEKLMEDDTIFAYPSIAAKALYQHIVIGLNSNSQDQAEEFLHFFKKGIEFPKTEYAFIAILNTLTSYRAVSELKLILLLKELTSSYRPFIITYQELAVGLLLLGPNSDNFSKELIEKWYNLFVLLTTKNALKDFPFDFFSTNPKFTKQLIPFIRSEKSEIFFKYFISYARSFLESVCQNGEDEDLKYFLNLFFKKNWFPPIQEPFTTDRRVLNEIAKRLITLNGASQKIWVLEILKKPFEQEIPLGKEEQALYVELLNNLEESKFIYLRNEKLQQCLNLGKSPYLLKEWLKFCVRRLVHENHCFAIALCTTVISFPKAAFGENFYEECLHLMMSIFETIVHGEINDDIIHSLKSFRTQLSKDQTLIQYLLDKCYSVEDGKTVCYYPVLAVNLISLLLSVPVRIPEDKLIKLAIFYQIISLNRGPYHANGELSISCPENKELFEYYLVKHIACVRVPLSQYAPEVQLNVLQRFIQCFLEMQSPSQSVDLVDIELKWYAKQIIKASPAALKICNVLQRWAASNQGIQKIIKQVILEIDARYEKGYLSIPERFAYQFLLSILLIKPDEKEQRVCLILWKLSHYECFETRSVDYFPPEACLFNQGVLLHFHENHDIYYPIQEQLSLLILKVLSGDLKWVQQQKDLFMQINLLYPEIINSIFVPLTSAFNPKELEYILGKELTPLQLELIEDDKFSINLSSLSAVKKLVKKNIPPFQGDLEPSDYIPFKQIKVQILHEINDVTNEYANSIQKKMLCIEEDYLSPEEITQFYEEYQKKVEKILSVGNLLSKEKFDFLATTLAKTSKEINLRSDHLEMLNEWYQKLSIASVIALFDQLNFTDRSHSNYIQPEELRIDGKIVTSDMARSSLQQLASNLILKEKFAAVPAAEREAEEFFKEMTICLKHIVHHLLQKKPSKTSGYLLELANIGGQCAVAYQEGLPLICCYILDSLESLNNPLNLHNRLQLLLHQDRWKWYRSQVSKTEVAGNANTLQYLQKQLEEPLGIFTMHTATSNTNPAFVASNSRIISNSIKFSFNWMYNASSIIDVVEKAINKNPKELSIGDISEWFKRNLPPGMTHEGVLFEIFNEEGELKREWIRYFLTILRILQPKQ